MKLYHKSRKKLISKQDIGKDKHSDLHFIKYASRTFLSEDKQYKMILIWYKLLKNYLETLLILKIKKYGKTFPAIGKMYKNV